MNRLLLLTALALAALFFAQATPPAEAQNKKTKDDVKHLKQQVKKLQGEVHDRDRRLDNLQDQVRDRDRKIDNLQVQLRDKKGSGPKGDETLIKKKELDDLRKKLKDAEAVNSSRFVRTVILTRLDKTPAGDVKKTMDDAVKSLGSIAQVRGLWVGKRAGVAPSSSGKDFDVGIVLLFDNDDGARKFQTDPTYKRFVDGLQKKWEEPVIREFMP